jgi:hypothetical protein
MLLRTTQKGVLRLGFGCCNQQQQPRGEGRDKTVKKILSLSLSLEYGQGWRPGEGGGGGGQRRWGGGLLVRRPLRLAEVKKRLGSDYHVSGDGLPWNWMIASSHGGYNI